MMQLFTRFLPLAAALAFLFSAGVAAAQAVAGKDYRLINPPQPTDNGKKVEVIEFFWYGCPHCYNVEPAVNLWLKTAPKDVVFRRIPANPSDAWGQMTVVYYTIEAMGLLDKFHQKIFDAMHKDDLNLANKRIRDEWLAKNGIDVAKYNEMEKSFTVATKVSRARQLTHSYRVDSVPRFFVNGKYYTTAEQAGGPDKLFKVVDQLIERARKEKS